MTACTKERSTLRRTWLGVEAAWHTVLSALWLWLAPGFRGAPCSRIRQATPSAMAGHLLWYLGQCLSDATLQALRMSHYVKVKQWLARESYYNFPEMDSGRISSKNHGWGVRLIRTASHCADSCMLPRFLGAKGRYAIGVQARAHPLRAAGPVLITPAPSGHLAFRTRIPFELHRTHQLRRFPCAQLSPPES